MAYYQARSAVCRSGVTYCGWTPPSVKFYVDGTDRTSVIEQDDTFTIAAAADGSPTTLSFVVTSKTGFVPVIGNDIKLTYATPDDYLFAGTLLEMECTPDSPAATARKWHCVATGYESWLLDRYDIPIGRYRNVGVETIVASIINAHTNGGFTLGWVPSTLGNLDVDHDGTGATVSQALQSIANSVDGTLYVSPSKRVNLYDTYPEAALATVTESTILAESVTYREDLTQAATRSRDVIDGSTTAAFVAGGSTVVSVQETARFASALTLIGTGDVTAVYALVSQSRITYTGTSVASGPGYLTGCSGVAYDMAAGEAVSIEILSDDTAAQTALATRLGGGLSGIATQSSTQSRYTPVQAAGQGEATITNYGTPVPDLAFTYRTPQRYLRAGRTITVAITVPFAVSGTFLVQSVTTTIRGLFGGTNVSINQAVTASRVRRTFLSLLRQ